VLLFTANRCRRWLLAPLHESQWPERRLSQHQTVSHSAEHAATTAPNPRSGRLLASVCMWLWRERPPGVLPRLGNEPDGSAARKQLKGVGKGICGAAGHVGMRYVVCRSGGYTHRGRISSEAGWVLTESWPKAPEITTDLGGCSQWLGKSSQISIEHHCQFWSYQSEFLHACATYILQQIPIMPVGVLALWPTAIPYACSFIVTNPTRNFVSKQDLTNELQIDAEQYASGFSESPLFAGVTFQKTKEILHDLSIQTCLHNFSAYYFAKCMFKLWYFLLCQSLKSDACWCRCMAMARGPGLQVFTFHRSQVPVWQCPHHTQTRCHSWTLCAWPQGLVSVTVYKSWTMGRSSAQFISIPDQRISIKFGVAVHTDSSHIQFWPILLRYITWFYKTWSEIIVPMMRLITPNKIQNISRTRTTTQKLFKIMYFAQSLFSSLVWLLWKPGNSYAKCCYKCTPLLINSVEQNPPWEADSFSGSQGISWILWNSKGSLHCSQDTTCPYPESD